MGFRDRLLSTSKSPPDSSSLDKKRSLSTDKDAQLQTPAKSESPPPSYSPEDLITPLTNLKLSQPTSQQSVPTVDHCIAHLKLLTAFANLREDVSTSEDLFSLSDSLAEKLSDEDKQIVLPRIREKRWQVYVTRAVERFRVWWDQCLPVGQALQQKDLSPQGTFHLITEKGQAINLGPDRAPPLDIVMVLHAFMLNPRCFFEDCIRQGKMDVWVTGMPWELINACIDNTSFEYNASTEAKENFEQMTGLAWDNLHDPPTRRVPCAKGHPIDCPWTDAYLGDPKRPFEGGRGYADKAFTATCAQCDFNTSHEVLKLQKYRRDLQSLLKHDVPMPGTILSLDGRPDRAMTSDMKRHEMFFPNRIILAGLQTLLLDITDSAAVDKSTVTDIRDAFEAGIKDHSLVRRACGTTISATLLKKEKISIRRMMSRYWENSSPFALDLVGAVMRQGTFVEKMDKIDWIHSPALHSTMARLLKKYQNFFRIMSTNPGHVAVPTLDVDLAWHTHQLSPPRYFAYAVAQTSTFIDHDDKIEESKLSDAFVWTSRMYEKVTGGEVYSECTCWYCEAIRESHTSSAGRLLSSSARNAQQALDRLHDDPQISSDPDKNPHISAHNAVKMSSKAAEMTAAVKAGELESAYQKACRRAKKKGREPPARDNYMYAYAWGYPIMYPGLMYAPYMGYPGIYPGMYPCNPACMSTTAGSYGNCAAGSCGGGVAAGACGGGGAGGCAGGAAGGCGGGGGGFGGCGGGGGGGCGGGGGGC